MNFSALTLSFLLFLSAKVIRAEDTTSGIRAGPNMAVLEANFKDGFRLSEKSQKIIGVVTKALGPKPRVVSSKALVYYGDRVGVYRLRNGWFKLIEIQKSIKANTSVTVNSSDLKDDDQIAVEGVALLRVSEMDAFGGEE